MKTGLLWFDDDPGRTLDEKIVRAIKRHREKYNAEPNICYVHPSALGEDDELQVGDVHVLANATVLRYHFWIGREDES